MQSKDIAAIGVDGSTIVYQLANESKKKADGELPAIAITPQGSQKTDDNSEVCVYWLFKSHVKGAESCVSLFFFCELAFAMQ